MTSPLLTADNRLKINIGMLYNRPVYKNQSLQALTGVYAYLHESLLHADLMGNRYISGIRSRESLLGSDHEVSIAENSLHNKVGFTILQNANEKLVKYDNKYQQFSNSALQKFISTGNGHFYKFEIKSKKRFSNE